MFWTSVFSFISDNLAVVLVLGFVIIPQIIKWLKKIKWTSLSLGPLKIRREKELLDRDKANIGRSNESQLYKLASENIARVMKHTETYLRKWVQYQLQHYRRMLEVKISDYCSDEELEGCSEYALDHIDFHYYTELVDRMMEVLKDAIRNDMIKNHLVQIAFMDPEAYIEGKIVDLLDLTTSFLIGQYEDKVVVTFQDPDGRKRVQNYQRLVSRIELSKDFKNQYMTRPTEFMALVRRIYAYALAQARLLDKGLESLSEGEASNFKNPELLERLTREMEEMNE